ncbi:MAG TPA: isoprenylcysteine carboxylmethyltransferase family protein [Stellaceae bacterium]|jgi:methyltransferase|nr:isoprenylcysteine carboxylmethyltransferase family protein [Stellaceae bacterium]
MTILYWILLIVAVQRLAELVYANRNTQNLLARGGVEIGRRHYPLFVLLHGGWLIAMLLLIPAHTPPIWPLVGVLVLLQAARIWVIATLGPYWTTRIITLAEAPVVRNGPFRFLRHPNYTVVVAEIAVLPLCFAVAPQAQVIALVFSVLNLMLLAWRIRVEDAALRPRRTL